MSTGSKYLIHPLFSITLAQIPVLIFTFILASLMVGELEKELNTYVLVLFISAFLNLIIVWPILVLLLKFEFVNFFSLLALSVLAAIPVIAVLKMGNFGLIFLVPALAGTLVCWRYLKHFKLTSPDSRKMLMGMISAVSLLSISILLTHRDRSNNSYESSLESHFNSYRALDKEMAQAIERDREKNNESKNP